MLGDRFTMNFFWIAFKAYKYRLNSFPTMHSIRLLRIQENGRSAANKLTESSIEEPAWAFGGRRVTSNLQTSYRINAKTEKCYKIARSTRLSSEQEKHMSQKNKCYERGRKDYFQNMATKNMNGDLLWRHDCHQNVRQSSREKNGFEYWH